MGIVRPGRLSVGDLGNRYLASAKDLVENRGC